MGLLLLRAFFTEQTVLVQIRIATDQGAQRLTRQRFSAAFLRHHLDQALEHQILLSLTKLGNDIPQTAHGAGARHITHGIARRTLKQANEIGDGRLMLPIFLPAVDQNVAATIQDVVKIHVSMAVQQNRVETANNPRVAIASAIDKQGIEALN